MYHSFSSQSFVKPSQHIRLPQAQHRIQNDITVPKEYAHYKQSLQQVSEDSPQKSNFSTRSISKLKKKIKQIKCALKIAEDHNEQLHIKLNQQKKYFQEQKSLMEVQVSKYKNLYQMLIENYEGRSLQLKEAKKRIKKLERQESKSNLELNKEYESNLKRQREEDESRKLKEAMSEQEVNLEHIRHENKLLREQMALKNKKISEYQILIQTYHAEQVTLMICQTMRKSPAIRSQEFLEVLSRLQIVEEENKKLRKDKDIAFTKTKRLEVELESTRHLKQSTEKDLARLIKQHQQLKLQSILAQRISQNKQSQPEPKWKILYEEVLAKYNQLLKFSYEIQRDFERQLHTMAKQMTRRQIVKNPPPHP